ncbi:caspase family protein [Thermosynechococcus sp. QS41]|uniref:caspase family protein n=1 Tax=Thermosynechococcus sp. QS41 TaxID=3074101 RepID=UPI002877BD59|nr:caspase family protein [Thermosynechococcus sp. QS41]WNC60965.1 caspase family protein [Thermosynechococcus sp. QS41]
MRLSRRSFLYGAAALTLMPWVWQTAGGSLADSLRPWRALLIGINHYPQLVGVPPLGGCLTDVELVKNLLLDGWGLADSDITLLTEQAATLDAVQETLGVLEHAGQPLLVYFSGYGTLWQQQPALVFADATAAGEGILPLAELLRTKGVQVWLDTRFSPPLIEGEMLRWRFVPLQPVESRGTGQVPKDHLLWADLGVETHLNGVPMGLFTASLSHYLAALGGDRPLATSLMYTADELRWQTGAEIHLVSDSLPGNVPLSHGFDGVVQSTGHDRALQVWCGGLSPWLLAHCHPHSRWSTADGATVVDMVSFNGIMAQGVSGQPLQVGDRLYEQQRRLGKNLQLQVALDPKLSKIERVDAINALTNEENVAVLNGSESLPDVVLTRSATGGSYGLEWPVGTLLQHSCTGTNEAAKASIRRLNPLLNALLAQKWLTLTLNPTSSQVAVCTTLEQLSPTAKLLSRQSPPRSPNSLPEVLSTKLPATNLDTPLTLAKGDTCRWSLYNYGDRSLNIVAFAWDSSQGILLLPLQTQSWQLAVAPGLNIPLYTWTLNRPCQWLKVFIISSHRPLTRFSQLSSHPSHSEPLLISGEDSLALVLGLLGDLSSEPEGNEFCLDVREWCTQGFTLRVV